MKIFSWNVNGLRSVIKKNFYEFLEEYDIDVLCLQETRITEKDLAKVELNFKHKIFNFAEKAGYSGTCIMSQVEPISMEIVNLENHPLEGRICRAEFEKFILFSVYVPNSKNGLERLDYRENEWDKDLREYLNEQSKIKPVIMCGDLNVAHTEIDLTNPKQNRMSAGFTDEERRGMDLYLEQVPLVDIWRNMNPERENKYTWWSYRSAARLRNVGWRIDYFLISPQLQSIVNDAQVLDEVLGSDHCPVMLDIA
ncbi:MAG: exodeoxyribonuclease III [Opitutales bacterium]